MSVLLIHPEDELHDPRWSSQRWNGVFDLGRAGRQAYDRLSGLLHCPAGPVPPLEGRFQRAKRLQVLLQIGAGQLVDQYGLDWWELLGILLHEEISTFIALREFVEHLPRDEEVYVSRHGFHARALNLLLGDRLRMSTPLPQPRNRGPEHYLRLLWKFPPRQVAEIFFDKADPGYQWRGRLAVKKQKCSDPVVLLPSAYSNVSRMLTSYARTAPDSAFLLVTTRASGCVDNPESNVTTRSLSSYASISDQRREKEESELAHLWRELFDDLRSAPEFRALDDLGYFQNVRQQIHHGLQVRDAWRNVLDHEPVRAVFCGDDSNLYTHIPLLLARRRGLPTLTCHHGALDGHRLFKQVRADVLLAKGKMEEDYLVTRCGVPREKIRVAAPPVGMQQTQKPLFSEKLGKSSIVFFSEPYEISGGRTAEFYGDVLPRLADVATATGRQLIVKLHPMENMRERTELLGRVLSKDQMRAVRVRAGALDADLMSQTWCGVTVLSTVAIECLLADVPCFLCKWLDHAAYGYLDQFLKFDVALALEEPGDIDDIPRRVGGFSPNSSAKHECWSPTSANELENLLNGECEASASLAGSSVA